MCASRENYPRYRIIPSLGMAVSKFSLAVDRGYRRKERNRGGTSDFINITVFGKRPCYQAKAIDVLYKAGYRLEVIQTGEKI